jgi:hypothetical protein
MKSDPGKLYDEMLIAIADKIRQPNKTEMVEGCFWIASKYWETLKKETDTSIFNNEASAINFFKKVKPKFTSQVQYYSMLAEAILFVPEETDIQYEYWKKEQARYLRFCDKHKKFVEYYESGAVYLDSIYFVKVGPDWIPSFQPVNYDADKKFCSSHDHLVRGLLAHRMYNAYVQERLLLIKNEL